MIAAPLHAGKCCKASPRAAARRYGRRERALEREQRGLLVEAAAVAAEAVRAEHAVARADHRDRVGRAGLAGRAHGTRVARIGRELRIGHRRAVRDAHHGLAAGAAEAVRERPVELDVELLEVAGEVAAELVVHVGERGVVLATSRAEPCPQVVGDALRRLARERQAQQAAGPPRERQDADRRVDGGHREHACRVDDRPGRARTDTRAGGRRSSRPRCFHALLTLPLLELALAPHVVLELLLDALPEHARAP